MSLLNASQYIILDDMRSYGRTALAGPCMMNVSGFEVPYLAVTGIPSRRSARLPGIGGEI
jgi:hypothetical protein